jgi:AcrR family transcriptional regulator
MGRMVTSTSSARRDELLEALVELFLAEGFGQFTLADIAARLRCSKSTLYALGHSKEQVTVNAVVAFFRRATASVEAATAAHVDPAARLVGYLRAVADALRPASPAFMADLAGHPATRAVYERNTEAAAKRVRELIEEGISAGAFRIVNRAFAADTIAATMRRIQTGGVLAATGLHDADAYEELAGLVLHGLSRPRR